MDTIVLRNIKITPNSTNNDALLHSARLGAQLIVENVVHDETQMVEEQSETWTLADTINVSVIYPSFSIGIVQVDECGKRVHHGAIELSTEQISAHVAEQERCIMVETSTEDDREFIKVSFTAYLTTSNMNKGPSPNTIVAVVKSMEIEALIALLIQIVISDTAFMSPDQGLLSTIHNTLVRIPQDDLHMPRSLGLLANIHLARYDAFLKIAGDEANKYSMYPIYDSGINKATSMLEKSLALAAADHPKKQWMMTSLCMCYQRKMVQQISNTTVFRGIALKLRRVVPNINDEESQKAALSNYLGVALGQCFDQSKDRTDLDFSISAHEDAVRLTSDDIPHKLSFLTDLIDSLNKRIDLDGTIEDTRRLLDVQKETLRLIPNDLPTKLGLIMTLAHSFFLQFKEYAIQSDIDDSIALYEQALEMVPEGHLTKSSILNNLAASLSARGTIEDLAREVPLIYEAIRVIPKTDPTKVQLLQNLGSSLRSRIQREGWESVDLKVYTEVVKNTIPSVSAEDDLDLLVQDLAAFITIKFRLLAVSFILDKILPHFKSMIVDIPDSCPTKPLVLYNLGLSLQGAFEEHKDRQLLDQAIPLLEQSTVFSSVPSSIENTIRVKAYAQAYISRYIQYGDLSDLEKATVITTSTLDLLPHDHAGRPFLLHTISTIHVQRYLKDGDLSCLHQAIGSYQDAIQALPDNAAERFAYSSDLGFAYLRRFEELHEPQDIDEAIQMLEDSLKGLHNDPVKRADCMLNLSRSLFFRFNELCQMDDLHRAAACLEDSFLVFSHDADMTSHKHKRYDDMVEYFEKFSGMAAIDTCVREMQLIIGNSVELGELGLADIAIFLSIRLGALQGAIESSTLESLRKAVELIPDARSKKGMWMNMLGDVFLRRFDITRDLEDLGKAVHLCEEAFQQHGPSTAIGTRPFSFAINLAAALNSRFHQSGDLVDLNRSIRILEDAVSICPDEETAKYRLLHNFAASLMQRYDLLGDIIDFNKSATAYQDASMSLRPADRSNRLAVHAEMSNVYLRRLKISGDVSDANRAIDLLQSNLEILSQHDPKRINAMSAYAMAILDRYWHFRNTDDINDAISTLESILSLVSEESAQRASIMHNLGTALAQRFVQIGELDDINRCLSLYNDARGMLDENHPWRGSLLFDIGRWLPTRYERLHDVNDLNNADIALAEASSLQSSPCRWRFRAASLRGYWCQSTQHGSPLEGYTTAMELLPNLAWLGNSIQNRQFQLLEAGEVVGDAVAAAIESLRYDLALEWFEQGRSVIWGQILELRTPADALLATHPELARKFTEISTSLGNMEESHDQALQRSISDIRGENSDESAPLLYHELAHEREKLLQQIRTIDGFQNFLRPKNQASLLRASAQGPVITVNVNQFRCDALVLMPEEERLLLIPLVKFSAYQAHDLMRTLKKLLRDKTGLRGSIGRPSKRPPFGRRAPLDPEHSFQDILATLWTGVAKPVLDGIGFKSPYAEGTAPPRIWWCLNGPLAMLPIHAAGLYGTDEHLQTKSKLSDYAVSSYTPSLSALINSRKPRKVQKSNLATVSLPIESGLPSAQAEIEAIQRHARSFPISNLIESEATPKNVYSRMQSASWIHFACHGVQNVENTGLSALMLFGGSKLTLSEISRFSLPHTEFAFLSACQTATGDELLPEEAVHLAAGMLSAGYQGVVGTMWSISDNDGPKVADVFYSYIFKRRTPTPDDAAYALHFAVKALQRDGASFFAWVPFIHYGI